MSPQMWKAVMRLASEYLLITLPILIYVGLEALHHNALSYILISPEWSIGTIFVLLQTYRIFSEEVHSHISRRISDLLIILLVLVVTAASLNAYIAMHQETPTLATMLFKWVLFISASAIFIYVAGAAFYKAEGDS